MFDQNFNIKAMIKLLFKFLYTFSRFERLLHEDHDIALATLPFPIAQSDVPSTPGFSETNVNGPSGPFKKDENGDEITTVPYKQRTFKTSGGKFSYSGQFRCEYKWDGS